MAGELVFTVQPGVARPAQQISLAEAGLRERSDLQEWVRENPEILGDGVYIVTFEFGAWRARDGRAADRLDLLGLDDDGRLVVAELKRGPAPDTVEMQAIKYAAFASRFTPQTLAEAHAAYLSRVSGEAVSAEDALARLEEHAGGELDADLLLEPRIALMAASFPPQVTASVVWLTEMGLKVSLIEFNAYRTEHDLVLTVSQTWPVADVEDFTVSPRQAELRAADERVRTRRERTAVATLVAEGVIEDGAQLELEVRALRLSSALREQVGEWVVAEPRRARATWRNDPRAPLIWELDGDAWSPTGLAKEIVERVTGERPTVISGPRAWRTASGETLKALAGSRTAVEGRDWSDLHHLLGCIQPGEWTTYGDIAEAIDSSAQAVAGHIARCPEDACRIGYRVLNADGRVSEGFYWGDPSDSRDPLEVLRAEGVSLDADGRADPASRLDARALRERSG